jgi:pimeloyl-ACP methyl ester carboxylesterase
MNEPVAMEEFMIRAADPGIRLYVRNKHPESLRAVDGDRILLYVHGATYPAETSFDLRLNGLSWMDYIAGHGYDVYLVDVRGYGRSDSPPEMEAPPEQNEPVARTADAVRDVGAAVDFILERRDARRLNLMGWSWGTSTMGWYTARHNDRVAKLVLYAPLWLLDASTLLDPGGRLGAYRTVTRDDTLARWLAGVPDGKRDTLIPPGWFEAWVDATFASDTGGPSQARPVLRAPNGVLADWRDSWAAGKPLYDPADIRVPTFLAHAEWDADLPSAMLHAYFEKLVNTPYKRAIEIGEGTHAVMMEKNRMQLFEAVQHFLDERLQPGR